MSLYTTSSLSAYHHAFHFPFASLTHTHTHKRYTDARTHALGIHARAAAYLGQLNAPRARAHVTSSLSFAPLYQLSGARARMCVYIYAREGNRHKGLRARYIQCVWKKRVYTCTHTREEMSGRRNVHYVRAKEWRCSLAYNVRARFLGARLLILSAAAREREFSSERWFPERRRGFLDFARI